ncbi:DNA translocase FtsK [Cupriavidus pampae]|uniref:DNA translocase FtsK n=2 Tax=Cupriavidus pampae TaxID=659251 RepID=A0ABM8XH44_9BURK|nr:DNA translocase FtsK [Cupriavidus pampae]
MAAIVHIRHSVSCMARATTTTRTDPSALPSRIGKLLGEVRWFLLLAVTLGFLCVLASYSKADPGWSHANQVADIHNLGGRVGAWLADVLFFIFGFSAYWWSVLLLRRCWRGWRAVTAEFPSSVHRDTHERDEAGEGSITVSWIGFALTLVSSMGLEAIRMYPLRAALPRAPGGVLGDLLGGWLQLALGFSGATLLLLTLFAIGLSLFFHFSWLSVAEHVGGFVESLFLGFKARRESKQDRIIGEAAKVERTETVEVQRVRHEEAAPVQIVRPQAVPKHERVEREKQQPLFADIQDSDLPPLSLLDPIPSHQETVSAETLEFTSRLIEKKLKDFGVEVKVVAAYPGPVITRYEIEPATGVKGSQVVNLARDLARSLSLVSIRVVETIPGKNYMGLELPNPKRQTVRLSEILGSQIYNESASSLTMALGKDIAGKPMVADLARMPHCMVAGTTGSGKSVGINAMILSLLYKAKAESVRLILIDPKMLEMSVYEGIPHLLCPVVTDMRQAGNALNWAVGEMERRYKLMSKLGVRNLAGYNKKIEEAAAKEEKIPNPFSLTPDAPEPLEKLPTIVIVIDELADLMMVVGKKVEELIARIAQKARAAGLHLVLATQRPSVDVITGLIKANVPTRIAFQVSSKIDSRTILDQQGAEALLGMGDMLYLAPGTGFPVRVHGAFVSDEEVHRVVSQLKEAGEPNYIEGILEGGIVDGDGGGDSLGGGAGIGGGGGEADPLYDQAVEVVLKNRRASISLVQRHLRIGYNRAARLLEDMEKAGMVSAMSGNGNRDILVQGGGAAARDDE